MGRTLPAVMVVVMTVVVVRERLSRYGRDGKDGDSGEGKHQVAKLHRFNSSLTRHLSEQYLVLSEDYCQRLLRP